MQHWIGVVEDVAHSLQHLSLLVQTPNRTGFGGVSYDARPGMHWVSRGLVTHGARVL